MTPERLLEMETAMQAVVDAQKKCDILSAMAAGERKSKSCEEQPQVVDALTIYDWMRGLSGDTYSRIVSAIREQASNELQRAEEELQQAEDYFGKL